MQEAVTVQVNLPGGESDMDELATQFEAFRFWLGKLWATKPWLGGLLVLSVASIPVGLAWLGKLRRSAEARKIMKD